MDRYREHQRVEHGQHTIMAIPPDGEWTMTRARCQAWKSRMDAPLIDVCQSRDGLIDQRTVKFIAPAG
jgi:hypothetical protein